MEGKWKRWSGEQRERNKGRLGRMERGMEGDGGTNIEGERGRRIASGEQKEKEKGRLGETKKRRELR